MVIYSMLLEKQKMHFWPKLMTVMQVGYRKRNKFFNISYFGFVSQKKKKKLNLFKGTLFWMYFCQSLSSNFSSNINSHYFTISFTSNFIDDGEYVMNMHTF